MRDPFKGAVMSFHKKDRKKNTFHRTAIYQA